MNKFLVLISTTTILILVIGVLVLSRNNKPENIAGQNTSSSYEYFWGEGCPHCAKVAEFLESWENADKVQIDKKEVYQDKDNASLLAQRAKECDITGPLGVPLLYTPEGACISGDAPIIDYFNSLEF
jgi:glutaredoxin